MKDKKERRRAVCLTVCFMVSIAIGWLAFHSYKGELRQYLRQSQTWKIRSAPVHVVGSGGLDYYAYNYYIYHAPKGLRDIPFDSMILVHWNGKKWGPAEFRAPGMGFPIGLNVEAVRFMFPELNDLALFYGEWFFFIHHIHADVTRILPHPSNEVIRDKTHAERMLLAVIMNPSAWEYWGQIGGV